MVHKAKKKVGNNDFRKDGVFTFYCSLRYVARNGLSVHKDLDVPFLLQETKSSYSSILKFEILAGLYCNMHYSMYVLISIPNYFMLFVQNFFLPSKAYYISQAP